MANASKQHGLLEEMRAFLAAEKLSEA